MCIILLKLISKFIYVQNKQKPEIQKKKALDVTKKSSELLKSHIKKPQQKKRDFCDDEIEQMFIYEEPEGVRIHDCIFSKFCMWIGNVCL